MGLVGRPAIVVDPFWLKNATSTHRRIPLTRLAKALGIHRNTLSRQIQARHLRAPFSSIPDHHLDVLLRGYKTLKPNAGLRYIQGFLNQNGIRVQKARIRASLQRIDGLGQILRNHAAIDRRRYIVPHSNYLWHIDGHHKLNRWGIVIHGGADGNDRVVSDYLNDSPMPRSLTCTFYDVCYRL